MPLWLASSVGVIGAVHLATYYRGLKTVAGLLKALPILLLAGAVWTQGMHPYAGVVTLGLLLSAVGDVSLVFESGFVAGLTAFLLGHVAYICALAAGGVMLGPGSVGAGVLILGAAAIMLRILWPHVGRLRPAVLVYVGALSTMACCAAQRAFMTPAPVGAEAAALGALSFLASDGVLAVNRFVRPFRLAHAVVMVTYYLAQTLIAASAFGATAHQ